MSVAGIIVAKTAIIDRAIPYFSALKREYFVTHSNNKTVINPIKPKYKHAGCSFILSNIL